MRKRNEEEEEEGGGSTRDIRIGGSMRRGVVEEGTEGGMVEGEEEGGEGIMDMERGGESVALFFF